MSIESQNNVFKNSVSFYVEDPVGSRYSSFRSKLLTSNCPGCQFCIPKETAVGVVEKWAGNTDQKHTLSSSDTISGLCAWGRFSKILEGGRKKLRKCEFFGKERNESAIPRTL